MRKETLMLTINQMSFLPKFCHNKEHTSCVVSFSRSKQRKHCYDVNFPFILEYPAYKCNNQEFSILHPDFLAILPTQTDSNIKLLVSHKFIMVGKYAIIFRINLIFRHKD